MPVLSIINTGYFAQREEALPLVYRDVKPGIDYRMDIMVENKLIVQIKSIDTLADMHTAQLLLI